MASNFPLHVYHAYLNLHLSHTYRLISRSLAPSSIPSLATSIPSASLTAPSGARAMSSPLDGSDRPRSSTAVSPWPPSSVTACSPTSTSPGP